MTGWVPHIREGGREEEGLVDGREEGDNGPNVFLVAKREKEISFVHHEYLETVFQYLLLYGGGGGGGGRGGEGGEEGRGRGGEEGRGRGGEGERGRVRQRRRREKGGSEKGFNLCCTHFQRDGGWHRLTSTVAM